MPVNLRDALDETMRGWKKALPKKWRRAFANVKLNSAGVPAKWKHHPWVPIFPVFKHRATGDVFQADGIPRSKSPNIVGVPFNAHTFRALLTAPEKVRVVIVGQDPYPDIVNATGQSFEQGNLSDWVRDSHRVAGSLRPILKLAGHDHTNDRRYSRPRSGYRDPGWDHLTKSLSANSLRLASPDSLFAAYQRQGVLWINTTLSISLFRTPPGRDVQGYQTAHAEYWKPFVSRLFEYLVSRAGKPVVFGLWGGWAKGFKSQIKNSANVAGTSEFVRFVEAGHPVTPRFLARPKNVLSEINEHLKTLGSRAIDWLPA